MYQQISKGFAEIMENKQQVITTDKLWLKCLFHISQKLPQLAPQSTASSPAAVSSRATRETDLQECEDKEVTMIEEVNVGRVGCCRADSWRLWKTRIIDALLAGPQLQQQFCFCNSSTQKY